MTDDEQLRALAATITSSVGSRAARSEADLQAAIARALEHHDPPALREVRLSPADRPDFLVGRVAIEVKVRGPAAPIRAQVARYLEHDEVGAVLVVTSRIAHRATLAPLDGAIRGKRVRIAVVRLFP